MSRDRGQRPPVFQSDRPLVFAHRGGAKLAPENTLVAFDSGLAHGADGMELDVHLSADGVPVVIHDPTLDRTTDTTGPVGARTVDQLARVDAGYQFQAADHADDANRHGAADDSDDAIRHGAADDADIHPFRGRGIGVPTLESVLRRYTTARMIIEIKGAEVELARAVAGLVRTTGAADRVCIGSFHRLTMEVVRADGPELVTSASRPEVLRVLHRSWVRWPFASRQPYWAMQVPRSAGRVRVVSKAFIDQVHRGGQVLQVWVVDAVDEARHLFDWGVDGVISDRPDLIVPMRDAWVLHKRTTEQRTTESRKHGRTH